MRTELLGQESNVVRVKVEFETAEFVAQVGEVTRDIAQNVRIPGFRKGHIPRKVLEMRFGKDNIHQEALEKMLPEALKQITADYDLDIMNTPTLKIDEIRDGQPVTCELVIEVRPEVELPEIEDIEVERLRQEVKDETVDAMVIEFRKQFATLNPVDRAAGESDVVSASFVTHVPGDEKETPPGEPQVSSIDLSEPAVRAEVKNALLGKSKGDEVSTEFVIEEDYRDTGLAGKRIRYEITVNGVNEKILPEMGPDFFKKVLNADIDTEAAFMEEIKKRTLAHQETEETDRVCEKAVTDIVARAKLDLPGSLMERQVNYVKEQDAADIKQRYNIGMENYLEKIAMSPDQYEQVVREKAEASLRRTLVMDEIARNFGVEVKQEDLEAEISRLAALYGMERAKVRAHYYKNENNMSQLSSGLQYDKTSKVIMEKIRIKEVDKLSAEEPAVQENGGETSAPYAASAE